MTWREAVEAAVKRQAGKSADRVFSRQDLLQDERSRILSDCGGGGETPDQTISRVLQELRNDGVIAFLDDQGTYQLTT
jgi:DNA-binding IclR family transcriptional regulator